MNNKKNNLKPFLLTLGKGEKGKKIQHNLFKESGFIISGMEGSGKTALLKDLITQASNKGKKNIKLIIACSEKKDFVQFSRKINLLVPIITNVKDIEKQFNWLNKEVELRYDLLNKSQKMNFIKYNHNNKKKMQPIVFFIDDFPRQLLENKKFVELLFWMVTLSRAVGIFIVFTVQGDMFKNSNMARVTTIITSKLTFKLRTKRQSRNFVYRSGAEKLNMPGEALYDSFDIKKVEFCNVINK